MITAIEKAVHAYHAGNAAGLETLKKAVNAVPVPQAVDAGALWLRVVRDGNFYHTLKEYCDGEPDVHPTDEHSYTGDMTQLFSDYLHDIYLDLKPGQRAWINRCVGFRKENTGIPGEPDEPSFEDEWKEISEAMHKAGYIHCRTACIKIHDGDRHNVAFVWRPWQVRELGIAAKDIDAQLEYAEKCFTAIANGDILGFRLLYPDGETENDSCYGILDCGEKAAVAEIAAQSGATVGQAQVAYDSMQAEY